MPGESHGQRSLAGYSPWGHKESDMTERLHFHLEIKTPWDKTGQVWRIPGKRVAFPIWLLSWDFCRFQYCWPIVSLGGSTFEDSTNLGLEILEKQTPESSKKQHLNFQHTDNYWRSISIVLGTIINPEMTEVSRKTCIGYMQTLCLFM